jgi:hypothetical protein
MSATKRQESKPAVSASFAQVPVLVVSQNNTDMHTYLEEED